MKKLPILPITLLFLATACTDSYIDELQHVAPGPDEEAPAVTLAYPLEGTLIRVIEDVAPIDIQFTVTDDIEIRDIVVELNGEQITSFDDFVDYRKAIKEHTYENLTNGEHTLAIVATDASGKSTTHAVEFEKVAPYRPIHDGEIFYMPFDGDNVELVTITNATRVGSPGFTTSGKLGSAYAGATDSYLTLPTTGLTNPEFSAVMWYKLNATPARAGILVISPPDEANPSSPNNRTSGFRFFREGSATDQTFKLNVGTGSGESWFDGQAAASVDPATTTDWIHLAFTISGDRAAVYINGEVVIENTFPGVDWTGADILSIGSGAPRFTGWDHLSDLSHIDELRIFDKELSQTEIQDIMGAEE